MATQPTANILRKTIGDSLQNLRNEKERTIQSWNKERKNLLDQCMKSVTVLATLIAAKTKEFQPLFDDIQVKDELFKLFYGNKFRIGQYFLLPLFELDEDINKASIALAWDVRTATVSLKMICNASDGSGKGVRVVNNFFQKAAIEGTKRYFLQSNSSLKEDLLKIINDWNGYQPLFNQRLTEQVFWKDSEQFLKFLGNKYGEKSDDSVIFSERLKSNMEPKAYGWFPRYGSGGKDKLDRMREFIQELLDEGYLDSQKVLVDVAEAGSEECHYVDRTVKYVRATISKAALQEDTISPFTYWENVVCDEPTDYSAYASFGAGD